VVLLREIGGSLLGGVELTRVGVPLADFPEVRDERKCKLRETSSPRMTMTTTPMMSQRRCEMPDIGNPSLGKDGRFVALSITMAQAMMLPGYSIAYCWREERKPGF